MHVSLLVNRSVLIALFFIGILCLFPFRGHLRAVRVSHTTYVAAGQPDFHTRVEHIAGKSLDENDFGKLGERILLLRRLIEAARRPSFGSALAISRERLTEDIERLALTDFPFIRNPSNLADPVPLQTLRKSIVPGSRGIVIPVGSKNFRYACHLVASLKKVLNSTLPIEIYYSGESDLTKAQRETISHIAPDVSVFDVTQRMDDRSMGLEDAGWAIKPFAALSSSFEQVILLDADAVFVQQPEVLLKDEGYLKHGALFFHDRLLWKGSYRERHEWWESELKGRFLSDTIQKSRVYTEGYAEEMDSGVVVLDKSRLPIFLGLLHVCWQNSAAIREFTYKMMYGDKETWWFGFELSGATYAFEDHYGAIAGNAVTVAMDDGNGGSVTETRVCSFTIAHLDAQRRLLWFNGSLLKNKLADEQEYAVPEHWMVDGQWLKGLKKELSCMRGGSTGPVSQAQRDIVGLMVKEAKRVDEAISYVM